MPTEGGTIEKAAGWVAEAKEITALTGAGLSTDSGIPDFRGPQGLWTTNPKAERLSSLQHYMEDPEVRVAAWQARLHHPAWTAAPNPGQSGSPAATSPSRRATAPRF